MNKVVKYIIEHYFDRNFFFEGSVEKEKLLEIRIKDFEFRYPNLEKDIETRLQQFFPGSYIYNFTHFFRGERCIRYEVRENGDTLKTYFFLWSIFNYFSVYRHPREKVNGKYRYGKLEFLNPGDSTFCDDVFQKCMTEGERASFEWLPADLLETKIDAFSHDPMIVDGVNLMVDGKVTIADALFSRDRF